MEIESDIERCASCGAPVKAGRSVCEFCGSELLPGGPTLGLLDADAARVEAAFQIARRKLSRDPDDAAALCQLGACFFKRGQYAKAGETLARASELAPKSARVVYLRALSLAFERSWLNPEVAALGTQALQLEPGLADARCLLHIYNGRRLFEDLDLGGEPDRRSLEAALAEYRKARETPVPELLGTLYFFSAEIYECMGEADEAVAMFEAAFRYGYPQAVTLVRLGRALAACGRVKDAVAALARAAELDPANESVKRLLAEFQARSE